MSLGVSLFLVAIGAILTWAVTTEVQGIDLVAVGIILMIIGTLGFFLSLLFWYDVLPASRRRRNGIRRREEPDLGDDL